MGRHATIAGRQAASAAARSRAFTRVGREISVAARLGGGDPASNPRLRLALDHAREVNMPKDTIERLIKKATGELGAEVYEEIVYEAYGPAGCALMIEVMTDNRNRTNPEIKKILQKNGGSLAEMGAVAWMFKRKGVIDIGLEKGSEDQLMEVALESGAEDVVVERNLATVYTEIAGFHAVREALERANFQIVRSGLEYVPNTQLDVSGENVAAIVSLLSALEEHDDVQNVFHNVNLPDDAYPRE